MEALWASDNLTPFSSLINVPAGKIAVLFAVGFKAEAYKKLPTSFKRPQLACVRRILYGFDASRFTPVPGSCCGLYDVNDRQATELYDELVMTCGKPWQLSLRRNVACIPLPGIYRLQLNDSTAIGEAQVYVELYDKDSVPLQAQPLFFD